jgi:hypothetical protein
VKIVVVTVLVVVLLLAGLPLPAAMAGMGACEQCDEPTVFLLGCLAVLVSLSFALPLARGLAIGRRVVDPTLLVASRLDRPPQSA